MRRKKERERERKRQKLDISSVKQVQGGDEVKGGGKGKEKLNFDFYNEKLK